MRTKLNNEVKVSYKSLGNFVRAKRKSLGYSSAENFALANKIDKTYIIRLETGKQFGSPENFIAVANALGVNPGYMLNIFADLLDTDGSLINDEGAIIFPNNFNDEDKKLVEDLIAFINYRKQITATKTDNRTPRNAEAYEGVERAKVTNKNRKPKDDQPAPLPTPEDNEDITK